jgi:chemotaxis protein MotA
MDSISLVGITLGFAAILVGQVLEGGHIGPWSSLPRS